MVQPFISAGAQRVLGDADDQTFCEMLLMLLEVNEDREEALATLYLPWILERLEQVRTRKAAVFFGTFLGPLKRLFPRQVFVGDLFQAMHATAWESQGQGGDVPPVAFTAAAQAFLQGGDAPGEDPGWVSLAPHYTVRRGEMTIVTGVASHMKTTFLQALCLNLARDAGWCFGLFSPEQAPVGRLARLLVEAYTGFRAATMDLEWFLCGLEWVVKHFHPIAPPEEVQPTLPWILGVARQQIDRYGISGLVIDPWNEVDHQFLARQSETQYISEALSRVRRFARYHDVHVWVIAHPTKMQKAVGGPYAGNYPPPTPYDISGSAHWYNKADNCLCVWRDVGADSAMIEVHIQKVRYRAVGKPGMVSLLYEKGRFHEIIP